MSETNRLIEYFNGQNYHKTIELADSLLLAYPQNSFLYRTKGNALFNIGMEKEGIECVDKAIELNPRYLKNYRLKLHMMLTKHEDFEVEELLNAANKALEKSPDDLDLLFLKARIYQVKGDEKGALEETGKILKIDSTNYDALAMEAHIYRLQKNYGLALMKCNMAINSKPEDPMALEERGFLYLEKETYQMALEDFQKVVALNSLANEPTEVQAYGYNNRGFAYYKNDCLEEALRDINYAIELLPENAYAYKNRALVYIELGEKDKACQDLTRAENIGDNTFKNSYGEEVKNLIRLHCN